MTKPESSPTPAQASATPNQGGPFDFVKFLSWSLFVLLAGFSLALSISISNYAETALLSKQKQFALLLAENLNHQIYRRFTLPTLIGYGYITLKNEEQYARLDQVVLSTIHSFHVMDVRIYDLVDKVSYSTNKDAVGVTGQGGAAVKNALDKGESTYAIVKRANPFFGFFFLQPKAGDVALKLTYPLRAEQSLSNPHENPIIGILEITQDITEDYETVLTFQRLVVVSTFLGSFLLFFVLRAVFRRADRMNAERIREKERLERQLHQQEKLAGMGRMVAGVAHEIRNPLGIIQSSAELLMKKASKENDRSALILKAIYDEAKRLGRIVGDFLDYARPRTPRRDPVNLAPVLDQMAVFLERECAGQQVELIREYPAEVPAAGDKDLLYRAIYNIVSNAIQALAGTGQPGQVTIGARTGDGETLLTFADTGPGFDASTRDKALDPFFTTKDQGTGLGLAIVANIVESHGGRLSIADNPGGGALVQVVLPAPEPPAGSPPDAPAAPANGKTPNHTE
jgi:signal transduction histidine kinase